MNGPIKRFAVTVAFGAAASLLVAGQVVRADEPAVAPAPATTETESAAPMPLGMDAVQALGLQKPFADLRLTFDGWVEQSYTYNVDSPASRSNDSFGNDRSNDYQLNQVVVQLHRDLNDGKDFDWGFKVAGLAGTDARYLHQNGLAAGNNSSRGDQDNMVQIDPWQFYIQARLPVGNGLTVKAGRYPTPIGYEVLDAPGNALFSHSRIFGIEPLTHTGIQFDYPLTDSVGVYYGLVIGWDDFADRNSSVSHMVGASWAVNDKTNLLLNLSFGPEQVDNNHTWRSMVDIVATYQATDALSLAVNADFKNENGVNDGTGNGNNIYGLAAYATYTFSPQLAATVRGEYYRDTTTDTGEILGLTAGLDIHPCKKFMNLRVRPEVQWQHHLGSKHEFDESGSFDQSYSNNQVLFAVDVIVTF